MSITLNKVYKHHTSNIHTYIPNPTAKINKTDQTKFYEDMKQL